MRWLAQLHRWIGVGLFLIFALWFASGAVMHFVPFPSLNERQRLARSTPIELERVRIAPAAALALKPQASTLRMVGVEGRPVYVLEVEGGDVETVGGDTGLRLGLLAPEQVRRIAAEYSASAVADVVGPFAHDQWTIVGELNAFRPLYRARLQGAAGTDLYVSARTGEIVQATTASERRWNWCGAVLHWIYFSALRAHWAVWDRLVWWLALIALSTTVAGLWLGWLRFRAARRSPKRKLTPFRGWLGWHHRIGLFVGVFVLIWMFSGWLSMDHGRLFPTGAPSRPQAERLRGVPLPAIAAAIPLSQMQHSGPAAELIFSAIAGRPFLLVRGAAEDKLTFSDTPGQVLNTIPIAALIAGVRTVWPGQAVVDVGAVSPGSFYSVAEGMSVGTRLIRVGQRSSLDIYIDQGSGRIVTVMDSGRRVYEWLYYALHTFKFPGLIAHPTLRHVIVVVPLGSGFIFSLTGAIIAISRLRASFRRRTV